MYNSQQSQMSAQEAQNMRRQIGFAALGGLVGGTAGGWAGSIDFQSAEQGQPTYTTPDTTVIEQERALGYTKYAPGDTVYDIAHEQVVDKVPEMDHLSMQERDNLVMNFIEKLRHDPELSVALTGSYSPDYIQAGDEVRLDSWKQLMSEESGSIKNRAFDWELDRADDGQGNFESMTAAADALDESTQAGAVTQEAVQAAPEAMNPLAEYAVQPGDNLWNLWGEHAGAPLTDAQKVAMEEMVRSNPAAFGVDSSNPDLIYTGEDINLQAMFDSAEHQGIIPPEANPHIEDAPQPRESVDNTEAVPESQYTALSHAAIAAVTAGAIGGVISEGADESKQQAANKTNTQQTQESPASASEQTPESVEQVSQAQKTAQRAMEGIMQQLPQIRGEASGEVLEDGVGYLLRFPGNSASIAASQNEIQLITNTGTVLARVEQKKPLFGVFGRKEGVNEMTDRFVQEASQKLI